MQDYTDKEIADLLNKNYEKILEKLSIVDAVDRYDLMSFIKITCTKCELCPNCCKCASPTEK